MSSSHDIKNSFNKYISIYEGLIILENNYDESYLIPRIMEIATNNKEYTNDFCKIIITHLKNDGIKNKLKLFNIIDSLFKSDVGESYINKLNKYIYENFKECFTMSDLEDRILLFKIFYTWKYLLPRNLLEKISEDSRLDEFKKMFMKNYPGKIEKYDQYNEKMRLKIEEKKNGGVDVINNTNNNNNINDNINLSKYNNNNNDISKTKKTPDKNMLGNKRKSSHEKSTDGGNRSTSEIKALHNPISNGTNSNTSIKQNEKVNKIINTNNNANNNNNNNELISNQSNQNNSTLNILNILKQSGLNIPNLQNSQNIPNLQNLQNINNTTQNNLTNILQQQLLLLLNMKAGSNSLFNSSNPKASINEIYLFNFLQNTNTKLNTNFRFFSSLAKYYNEVLSKRDMIDIKCNYEDIYNNNNEEYKSIRQKVDSKLFKDISKNICAICGFRTLFYNNLVEHLDIHFNMNYLKMEGKNLFRKIGHNRNNWISGENIVNKNIKNKVGYTLGNLLYYKNMMNNNLIKINNEHEEDNEEFMYPIYEDNKEKCNYCGDEFKKVFSTKYNFWFYYKVVEIKEEKKRNLVHQTCYDELIKKV